MSVVRRPRWLDENSHWLAVLSCSHVRAEPGMPETFVPFVYWSDSICDECYEKLRNKHSRVHTKGSPFSRGSKVWTKLKT